MSLPVIRRPGERCCAEETRSVLESHEVEATASELDILAHPIRLQLLAVLAASEGEVCVCDLQGVVPVKQPTVSHHLGVLRKAGLVSVDRRGLWAYYRVEREALAAMRQRISAALGRLEGQAEQEIEAGNANANGKEVWR